MGRVQQPRSKPARKGSHSLLKGPKTEDLKRNKTGKLTSLKNKIRGVERLLRKASSDHKLKRSLEGKLSELQSSLAKHDKEATERKYAVRYHKIRFFERVKLERRVKQIEGKADRGHALSAEEQQHLKQHKENLQYVMHFPKGERYVSIVKEAADPAAQAKLETERKRLKAMIRHQLAESAMLAQADEGLGQSSPMAGTALNTEADAFFLESSDSDSALETSAAPLLLSDEGAQQSVSQTQAADSVSTAQAQIAAGKQVQFQQPKRQAGCRSDSHVPSRNPRHNSSNVAPSGAADQHLQQKQQPVLHQQAAGSPQKPAKFLQNGRLSKFAKDSKHTELTVAGVPPRKSALGGADLAQKSSVKEQQAQVQGRDIDVSAANRSLELLQRLQRKHVKQQPAAHHRPSAAAQPLPYTTNGLASSSDAVPVQQLQCRLLAPAVAKTITQDRKPVRSRAQGGRKRRK
ncbi:TPA: hypothetical protein ACH3X2_004095 [Trebouxia sp. C0005]